MPFVFLIGGAIFGYGLSYSGMSRPEVVLDFLNLRDFGLVLVLGAAIAVTLPVFWLLRKPLLAERAEAFSARADGRRLLGSVLFGLGWGISGLCPAAAFAGVGNGNLPLLVAVGAMFLGAWAQARFLPDKD